MKTIRRWPRSLRPLLMLAALVAVTGCSRRGWPQPALSVNPPEDPPPAGRPAEGSHDLTDSPPVTPPDLRRMLSVGFPVETLVSEIQRRGVLRRPDADECRQVEALPGGQRLLDAMQSPRNLLSLDAVAKFSQRQGGSVPVVPSSGQTGGGFSSARPTSAEAARWQQQVAEHQRRHAELNQKLQTMKERRRQMKRRGEGVHLIGIEIDRLERELAALPPPPRHP